jgi:hypothetical protein
MTREDPSTAPPTLDPATLRVMLRERPGINKPEESLAIVEPFEVEAESGMRVSMAPAWYDLVGDLQLRLVHDTGDYLLTLHASQLDDLRLTVDEAIAVALANLHRQHGEPQATPWHNLQRVAGRDEDVSSAYFLDRAFWRARLAEHPEGVVVAVPRIDALLFAPLSDDAAVASMRQGVPGLHAGGGVDFRLSSALYLFRDERWTVFQAPAAA